MPILFLFVATILGVIIGFFAGWISAMVVFFAGFGNYALLVGTIVWAAVSVFGFLIGLFIADR